MCPKMDFLGDKSRIRNDRCVSYRCRSPRCSCSAILPMIFGHRARLRGGRIAGDDVLVSRRHRIAAAGSGFTRQGSGRTRVMPMWCVSFGLVPRAGNRVDDYPKFVAGAHSSLGESIDRENRKLGFSNREVNRDRCSRQNQISNGIFHNRVLTRRDCRSNTVQGVLLWVAADLDVVLGEFECSQGRVTIHHVVRVVRGDRDGDRVS